MTVVPQNGKEYHQRDEEKEDKQFTRELLSERVRLIKQCYIHKPCISFVGRVGEVHWKGHVGTVRRRKRSAKDVVPGKRRQPVAYAPGPFACNQSLVK